ncbi:hypothetical protein ACFQI7_26320 [Paenibacillus allorhizosphaerae]|uniref:hypothetical protein n=1 Tax=Paenibacillus allorhizosphaerae TaxID=2849866 RepID=UPI001C40616C|nr:hypothetical protein [Paenibacillus allorhizosphaerae]
MNGKCPSVMRFSALAHRYGEQRVGRLGLRVRKPFVMGVRIEVEIFEIEAAELMSSATIRKTILAPSAFLSAGHNRNTRLKMS